MLGILVVADVGAVQASTTSRSTPRGIRPVLSRASGVWLGARRMAGQLAALLPELGNVQVGQVVGDLFGERPSMGIS
jgi:hypothetical protein